MINTTSRVAVGEGVVMAVIIVYELIGVVRAVRFLKIGALMYY